MKFHQIKRVKIKSNVVHDDCFLGRTIRNTVPSPGFDFTKILPLWDFTIPWTTLNPSPNPSPTSFVVKNGSKIRAAVSSDMPVPKSWIINSA